MKELWSDDKEWNRDMDEAKKMERGLSGDSDKSALSALSQAAYVTREIGNGKLAGRREEESHKRTREEAKRME